MDALLALFVNDAQAQANTVQHLTKSEREFEFRNEDHDYTFNELWVDDEEYALDSDDMDSLTVEAL